MKKWLLLTLFFFLASCTIYENEKVIPEDLIISYEPNEWQSQAAQIKLGEVISSYLDDPDRDYYYYINDKVGFYVEQLDSSVPNYSSFPGNGLNEEIVRYCYLASNTNYIFIGSTGQSGSYSLSVKYMDSSSVLTADETNGNVVYPLALGSDYQSTLYLGDGDLYRVEVQPCKYYQAVVQNLSGKPLSCSLYCHGTGNNDYDYSETINPYSSGKFYFSSLTNFSDLILYSSSPEIINYSIKAETAVLPADDSYGFNDTLEFSTPIQVGETQAHRLIFNGDDDYLVCPLEPYKIYKIAEATNLFIYTYLTNQGCLIGCFSKYDYYFTTTSAVNLFLCYCPQWMPCPVDFNVCVSDTGILADTHAFSNAQSNPYHLTNGLLLNLNYYSFYQLQPVFFDFDLLKGQNARIDVHFESNCPVSASIENYMDSHWNNSNLSLVFTAPESATYKLSLNANTFPALLVPYTIKMSITGGTNP